MTEYSDENIELIERYHSNSLSRLELEKADLLLLEDADFAELNKLWLEAKGAIHEYGNQKLKAELVKEYVSSKPQILRLWPLWGGIAVAAVIAVLLLFPGAKDPNDLYQEYYSLPAFGMRGGESVDRLSAQALYHDNRFEETIIAYEAITTDSNQNLSGRELIQLAISYAETQQLPKAISILGQFSEANPYLQQARWYSGLFYLKTGAINQAKDVFSIVAKESKDYGDAAREILNELP